MRDLNWIKEDEEDEWKTVPASLSIQKDPKASRCVFKMYGTARENYK